MNTTAQVHTAPSLEGRAGGESPSIVITGGAGFIGSHVVRLFVNKYPEYRIINLDKLTYAGNLANLKDIEDKPNYKFVKMDICDFDAFYKLMQEEHVTGIIHLAAESHVDRSIKDPFTFAQTNVMGTLSLLQAAKLYWESLPEKYEGKRFYHISTDEVYGALEMTHPEGVPAPFTTKASADAHPAYGEKFFTEFRKRDGDCVENCNVKSSDPFDLTAYDIYAQFNGSDSSGNTWALRTLYSSDEYSIHQDTSTAYDQVNSIDIIEGKQQYLVVGAEYNSRFGTSAHAGFVRLRPGERLRRAGRARV